MGTGTRLLVVDGEEINEGTSLYHAPSDEIAWVIGRGSDTILVDTVDESYEIPLDAFERGVREGKILVESQP